LVQRYDLERRELHREVGELRVECAQARASSAVVQPMLDIRVLLENQVATMKEEFGAQLADLDERQREQHEQDEQEKIDLRRSLEACQADLSTAQNEFATLATLFEKQRREHLKLRQQRSRPEPRQASKELLAAEAPTRCPPTEVAEAASGAHALSKPSLVVLTVESAHDAPADKAEVADAAGAPSERIVEASRGQAPDAQVGVLPGSPSTGMPPATRTNSAAAPATIPGGVASTSSSGSGGAPLASTPVAAVNPVAVKVAMGAQGDRMEQQPAAGTTHLSRRHSMSATMLHATAVTPGSPSGNTATIGGVISPGTGLHGALLQVRGHSKAATFSYHHVERAA